MDLLQLFIYLLAIPNWPNEPLYSQTTLSQAIRSLGVLNRPIERRSGRP